MTTGTDGVLAFLSLKLAQVRPPGEAAQAVQQAVALTRYAEGLTDEQELRGELEVLGYSGLVLTRLLLSASLRRQLELYRDRLAIWRALLKDGKLTESEFRTLLERAGVSQETVLLEMERARSQRPSAPVKSLDLSLTVRAAPGIVVPRLAPRAINLGLRVARAETVPRPPAEEGLDLGLRVLAVPEISPRRVAQSIEVTLRAVSVEEV